MSEENLNEVGVVDDEMPAPPTNGEVTNEKVATAVPDDLFEGVGELGEVLPKGTYHFRLDQTFLNWHTPKAGSEEERFGPQPNYGILWSVQQEPHVGKTFMDSCPWVNSRTIEAAASGDPVAKNVLRRRLVRAKAIIKAAEYPMSGLNIEAFFAAHPEIKILVGISERKMKDPANAGKYIGTGQQVNSALKYISLRKPA
jgi:hypothetical protein